MAGSCHRGSIDRNLGPYETTELIDGQLPCGIDELAYGDAVHQALFGPCLYVETELQGSPGARGDPRDKRDIFTAGSDQLADLTEEIVYYFAMFLKIIPVEVLGKPIEVKLQYLEVVILD